MRLKPFKQSLFTKPVDEFVGKLVGKVVGEYCGREIAGWRDELGCQVAEWLSGRVPQVSER